MERVWIVSEELYGRRDTLPQGRHADLVVVPDFSQFAAQQKEGERPVLLAKLEHLERAKKEFQLLACQLLPPELTHEKLLYAVRSVLSEARLQHDLEAAETVAWSGIGGQHDDMGIELLGSSILELSTAHDMHSLEKALLEACKRIVPAQEVKVIAVPETASSRVMGLYQLAIPVQFQGELMAHIYVRFQEAPEQAILEKVGEALLNLSDAVALVVERNRMITKAEETKAVWEASFDAVADPVAILDENFRILRGNQAFGKFLSIPLVKMPGREPAAVSLEDLQKLPVDQSSEWSVDYKGQHYRAFLDPIPAPLGAGRFVLRFHDITEERTLTEKILAKEQVAELGILVGSVAHEINNPIGGILAISQILQKDIPADSALGKDIANIVQSAERCRKIVRTMLSLVRKAEEEKRQMSVPECVQNALDLLGSEAKRLQVRLKTEFHGQETQVLASRNRLLQVFFHLFQQALWALEERKKRQPGFDGFLAVEVIPGFGNVEVKIEDNGDSTKHEYEIQSSVAFTVSKMLLEEQGADYFFVKGDGRNQQRLVFGQGSEQN